MTLPELLHAFEALGVKLSLRLVVDAPRGALNPEHKAALQAHRTSLLLHLVRSPSTAPAAPPARRYTWDELSTWRWGSATNDAPNFDIVRPDRDRMLTSLCIAVESGDSELRAERAAIQAESASGDPSR